MTAGTTYDDNAFFTFATTLLFFYFCPSAYYCWTVISRKGLQPSAGHTQPVPLIEVRVVASTSALQQSHAWCLRVLVD
jgi:hypothetical protein